MIFTPSHRDRAITFMDKLFENNKHVKIEHVPETKSLSQNGYLWLVFTHIAFETGATKDDMYYYYLNKFPKFKEINHLGKIVLVRISLSAFSKEQTSAFIDEVTTDARLEGFDIPDPEDKNTLIMYNFYRSKGLL